MRRRCLLLWMAGLSALAGQASAAAPLPVRVGFSENSQVTEVVRELAQLVFSYVPSHRPNFQTLPWTRVQRLMENGDMDMFVTYPATNRTAYAHFTKTALFTLDYGHLIYDKQGPKAAQILAANRFADLKDLVFVHQDGVEWEMLNVPSYIRRYTVNAAPHMFHMTFERRAGDFFIMYPAQAMHFAQQLGYEKQIGIRKVNFVPNHLVGLKIGIRKSYPDSQALVDALDAAMHQPAFRRKANAIMARYQRHEP
jgi:hypothetical protein